MIELSLPNLIVVPVASALLFIFLCAAWSSLRHPHSKSSEHICHCKYCNKTYLEKRSVPVSKCPRCEEINKRIQL